MLLIKYVCIQIFMFVGVSVIEILEFKRKKNMEKLPSITPVLQDLADFLSVSLVFNMFLTSMLIYRSQIEWNMKVKIKILICIGLMLNDHSNPYIESTTVLSDKSTSIGSL